MNPRSFLSVISILSIASLFAAGCAAETAVGENDPMDQDIPPTGRSALYQADAALNDDVSDERVSDERVSDENVGEAQEALTQAGIKYHAGPVMLGTVGIYYIWYGNWTNNSAKSILTDFAQNLGGSAWWNINTTYTNGAGTKLSNSVAYKGAYQYTGTSGYSKSLSDSDIQTIVAKTITGGHLPSSTSSIYFVLTSKDVAASDVCTGYCGWHTYASIGGSNIKYSLVGDAARCLSSCAHQSISPNGNPGADGMASTIAHEATETATDPLLNAWYDSSGEENADKCSWTWGSTSTASNGSKYNMTLGPRKYLIQQNWVNSGNGYCAKSF